MSIGFLQYYLKHWRRVILRDGCWKIVMAPQRIAQPTFVAPLVVLLFSCWCKAVIQTWECESKRKNFGWSSWQLDLMYLSQLSLDLDFPKSNQRISNIQRVCRRLSMWGVETVRTVFWCDMPLLLGWELNESELLMFLYNLLSVVGCWRKSGLG